MKILLLRDFLRLAATRDGATVSAYRRPMGYLQIVNPVAATNLTLPVLVPTISQPVGYAVIQCDVAASSCRWRDDGTAPTASVGMLLSTGQELDYSGDLTMIQFIAATGTPNLNISFYA